MTGLYQVGQRVEWTLTANGVVRRQQGRIAQVVPPGERPKGLGWRGSPRDHESYAVTAGASKYWPTVDALVPVANPTRETPGDEVVRHQAETAAGLDGSDTP